MKMPLKWAQSYADFTTTPQEFADNMTMTGSKVETFSCEADSIKNVVIGRVDKLERHTNSDHLWVCQVNIGTETVQIVTGAQNLKEGDICPVALHGAKLPGGVEIRKGKLRGEVSQGMLCSLNELGLTTHDFPACVEDGIMVLSGDIPLGTDAAEALGMNDYSFEFEITPNRPDCLSVRGLAREAAATYSVPFNERCAPRPQGEGDINSLLKVKVDCGETCYRYSAAMVDNVRIKPSPRWMRERLRLCGVRPINNIVDITNYVMLEYGQPMHAFDYAYVNGGAITVRMANQDETIMTLDGTTRQLDLSMMVIADEAGPIAIAGIMGGEYSGVYETTKQVVFESACFDGPCVRAASRKLGLRTESSGRFEKGLDPEAAQQALYRALELVKDLDAGDIIGGVLDDYPAPRPARSLPMDPQAVSDLLGIPVSASLIEDILVPLGFEINNDTIHIPSYRADVSRSCDIAEEIARFVGYNKIPSTVLRGTASAQPTKRQDFNETICNTLAGYGLWECETFSFYSPKSFDLANLAQDSPLRNPVRIMNPLGEDTSVMRTTALPSMMEVVARNWASRNTDCALYEMATEYIPSEDPEALPLERQKIIAAAYGDNWDYFAVKGVVEGLIKTAGIKEFAIRRNTENSFFHPGRCADIFVAVADKETGEQTETLLATIGEVHPSVLSNYGIKPRVTAADLSMEVLYAARGGVPQYKSLPKFPAVTRDLSLVADIDMPAVTIADTIRKAAGARLENLSLFDIYEGEKIGENKKSLAYSLILRDSSATLTDEEADAIIDKTLAALKTIDVIIRS